MKQLNFRWIALGYFVAAGGELDFKKVVARGRQVALIIKLRLS